MSISANTKLFGVVGSPIKHSLSPAIHNHWFSELGLDAIYFAFELESRQPTDDFRALYRFGVSGLNVTLPHKLSALESSMEASEAAISIGAANTLMRTKSGWRADNTDARGFLSALGRATGRTDFSDQKILVVGAGGSARAVIYALSSIGSDLTIVNRTIQRAEAVKQELAHNSKVGSLTDLSKFAETADIVVNATSMGHDGELPDLGQGNGRCFYDLSYGDAAQPALNHAQSKGWVGEDGLYMLVAQAAFAFKLWHGVLPNMDSAYQTCLKLLGRDTV